MTLLAPTPQARIPAWLIAIVALMACGAMLYVVCGDPYWLPVGAVGILEILTASAIALSAGAFAHLLIRRLAPDAPLGFRITTSLAVGLWGTSLLVLLGATLGRWGLWQPMWMTLLAGGMILAAWQGRHRLRTVRLPKFDSRCIFLAGVFGVCAGLWLAGALMPPGYIGKPDAYDVLEYHLQLPREFLHNASPAPLDHNVYSHYPLGVEMLFLLSMVLRGGAWEGMYLAKVMHGLFGVIAVAGLWTGLRDTDRAQSRFGALLLATTPAVLYLSWLAFSELAGLCYLVLALLWLRRWLNRPRPGSAAVIGLLLAGACGSKYLAVGFIAGPVLAVMLVRSVVSPPRFRQVVLAGAITLAGFSPWLVRNALSVGNPVFPLATSILGEGDFTTAQAQRWRDGHSSTHTPPVPQPPGWQPSPQPTRINHLCETFVSPPGTDWFGRTVLFVAAGTVLWLISQGKSGLRRHAWEWSLVAVAAMQVALWTAVAHGMPWRFLLPFLAPLILLAAGGLSRLATVRLTPPSSFRTGLEGGKTLTMPVLLLFMVACVVNLFWSLHAFATATSLGTIPPLPGKEIARRSTPFAYVAALPAGSRTALVGDATGFYFPPGTAYATAFDTGVLAPLAGVPPQDALADLRRRGVTHLLVHWSEIWRLAASYGLAEPLHAGLWNRARQGMAPDLPILQKLRSAGMVELYRSDLTRRGNDQEPAEPPSQWKPLNMPADWPLFTIYAIPPADAEPGWAPPPLTLPDSS